MIERLLLDRIDRYGSRASVAQLQQAAVFIFADEAESVLAFADVAVTRTQVAVQTDIGHGLPPASFMNRGLHRTAFLDIVAPLGEMRCGRDAAMNSVVQRPGSNTQANAYLLNKDLNCVRGRWAPILGLLSGLRRPPDLGYKYRRI